MEQNNESIVIKLLAIINDKNELKNCPLLLSYFISKTFSKCIYFCLELNCKCDDLKLLQIESVIDYLDDELNIGHWNKVAMYVRKAFTCACFIKAIILLRSVTGEYNLDNIRKLIKCIDMGILLGSPLDKNPSLLTETASILTQYITTFPGTENIDTGLFTCKHSTSTKIEAKFVYESLRARELDEHVLPSLEHFNYVYFKRQQPVKLCGCMGHWPASKKWSDLNYLLKIAGDRTVPVEIGSQYVDENWSQKLITFKEFIQNHYLKQSSSIGYLAQHNLFDQIPELREDICIPEYCCLSDLDNNSDPDINCWLGPSGTISPLHFDPKNNILAQVYGTKQVILFPPTDTDFLYPHEGRLLSNTSRVDPIIPNLKTYPDFKNATMSKCLLGPGEMLFIPRKWWHHVVALDKSFSVSFWWE